jgi:FKBP-type peptidyl-prolyl cis-trans isomerase FklB
MLVGLFLPSMSVTSSSRLVKALKSASAWTFMTGTLPHLVLKAGTGAKPADEASVLANYSGTLADGTVFDASPDGKPAAFKVNGVIPGWREALKLMPAGSTWRLVVPPKLAYGERGAGRVIGPNQVLQFEVELVEVN